MQGLQKFLTQKITYEEVIEKSTGIFRKNKKLIVKKGERWEMHDEVMMRVNQWLIDENITNYHMVVVNDVMEHIPKYRAVDVSNVSDFNLISTRIIVYVFYL